MSTPPSVIESELNFSFEIELISKKSIKYLIKLEAENYSNLVISAKALDNNLFPKVFINNYTPEKIKENKYFLLFDNLKEICDEISEKLKNEKISLKEDSKSLIISIPLNTTKIKEIIFELYEKELNTNEKFDKILSIIKAQSKEINELREKNNKLEHLFDDNKNIINQQKIKISHLEEQISIFDNDFIENLDSVIIKDKIQYKKYLKNWISPKNRIKAELLYRLTKDGNLATEFHKKCDNKGPTLILFDLIDGNKIGFYTPLYWESELQWKNDMDSFIFNLNKNQKHKKIRDLFSIYCNSTSGPCAGDYACEGPYLEAIYKRNLSMFNNLYENEKEIPITSNKIKLIDIEVFKLIIL